MSIPTSSLYSDGDGKATAMLLQLVMWRTGSTGFERASRYRPWLSGQVRLVLKLTTRAR